MTLNQAKPIEANVSKFKFFEAKVAVASNDEEFALAA